MQALLHYRDSGFKDHRGVRGSCLRLFKCISIAVILIQAGPAQAFTFTLKTPAPPATGYFFDWVLRVPAVVRGTPMNPSEVPAYDPPVYATAVNYNNGFYFPTNTSWQDAWYYFTAPSRGYIPMGFLRDYMGNHPYYTGHKTNTNLPPVNGSYDGMWTIAARKGWFAACMVDGAAAPLSGQQDFNTRIVETLYQLDGTQISTAVTSVTSGDPGTTVTTNLNADGSTTITTVVRTAALTQGKIDSVSLMTGVDPDTGLQISTGAPRMDFVLMDFEEGAGYQGSEKSVQDECLEVIRLVKASPNASVRSAWIGNYAYFNGRVVPGSYPWSCDYSSKGAFYLSSGMNVAQPACYPKTSYTLHTNSHWYGSNVSPSARASLFWAMLELCSEAARNLPENHLLIPWVVAASMYPGSEANPMPFGNEVPEREDFLSLIKHYRMRGADGIANNGMYHDKMDVVPTNSWIRSYARDTYRYDILEAWNSLNAYFDPSGVKHTELLNLGTPVTVIGTNIQDAVKVPMANKVSGLEWSGVRYGNSIRILVSNMNPTNSQSVTLPSGYGLPASTPSVAPNTHETFDYTITNPGTITYALTVNNGTGTGSYTNGQQVAIAANAPATGKTFDRWTGDAQYVASVISSNTTVTMPTQAIAVTATYVMTGNLITNGDVEDGTNNWSIIEEDGSLIAPSASAQSPFSAGTQGLLYTDSPVTTGSAGVPNSSLGLGTLGNGIYTLKFDYKTGSASGGSWTCRLFNNGTNQIAFAFTILGTSVQLSGTSGNTTVASGLTSNEWYHVEIGLDTVNQKYTGFSLVNYSGTVNTTYGEKSAYTTVSSLGLSRFTVVDVASTTVAIPLYLDNAELILDSAAKPTP